MEDSFEAGHVVVTGVAGFIGSHLAEALLARGHTVLGVDRRSLTASPAAADLMGRLGRPDFTFVQGDLARLPLEPLLMGAGTVFHLAGIPGVRPSWGPDFAEYANCNIVATQRLARACAQAGVRRMVVASSSSVYGSSGCTPFHEDGPVQPASPYGVTKLAGEQLCLAYATSGPRPVTTVMALRYFTVYGPRQRSDMLIGRVLRAAISGEPVRIHGDGSQRRDFTYVDDAVAATVAAGSAPGIREILNVGGGFSASVAEVVRMVERLTGRTVPVVHTPPSEGDVSETLAAPGKARDLLSWQPRVDLVTGIARQLEWMTLSTLHGSPGERREARYDATAGSSRHDG